MKRVAVIGAGAMGLATAYYLQKAGHTVTVFESDSVPGGMAAHFDFDGLSIERFYHFVCKADQPLFDLLNELGLEDAMQWRDTSMGFYFDGKLYPWGDPDRAAAVSRTSVSWRSCVTAFMPSSRPNAPTGPSSTRLRADRLVALAG